MRRPIHFPDRKVKIWSSESDRRRISLILMSQCGGTGSMSYRTYRSVRYRFDVVPNLPKCPVPVSMLYRYWYQLRYRRLYRYRRYRCRCRTELTEVFGAGIDVVPNLPKCPVPLYIDVVPNLPKCPVPIGMMYRTYRSIRYRYWCCSELTEVSRIGMKVYRCRQYRYWYRTTLIPKCPVPVLMSYRSYRSVRYR